MIQRYIKVLILYTITTAISTIGCTTKQAPNPYVRFVLRTMIGYSLFAYGLHFFAKRQHKSSK